MAVRALLHYALEVPDQTVGETFYRRFGLVDEAGRDGAVHLRPAPLRRDSVLLYGGPRKRLHHLAFGAPGDEYQAILTSIRRAGVREIDPPRGAPEGGGIGSNFFHYIRDLWGSFAEYFHDLDSIPEQCAWQPRDFPEGDALYRWGPPVPEDFGLNREVEG